MNGGLRSALIDWVRETFGAMPTGSRYMPLVKTNIVVLHEHQDEFVITVADVTTNELIDYMDNLSNWLNAYFNVNFAGLGLHTDFFYISAPIKKYDRQFIIKKRWFRFLED